MKPELVIFDIDGTLLDSREKYCECMAFVLRKFGTSEEVLKVIKETFGMPGPETMRRLGVKEHETEGLMADICGYIKNSSVRAKIFDGADEMLRGMQGVCKTAVATSRNRGETAADSDLATLLEFMDYVSTTDIGMAPKPAPDVLIKALESLSVDPSKAVYVGDTQSDMQAARAAGMRFILAGWNPVAISTVKPDVNTSVCLSVNDLAKYIKLQV